jgi:hypothetical protein
VFQFQLTRPLVRALPEQETNLIHCPALSRRFLWRLADAINKLLASFHTIPLKQ